MSTVAQFTYVSYDDHRVIMSDRWGDGERVTTGRLIPTTTFINPPLSTIGMDEETAKANAASRGHTAEVRFKEIADIAIMPRPKIVGTPEGVASSSSMSKMTRFWALRSIAWIPKSSST